MAISLTRGYLHLFLKKPGCLTDLEIYCPVIIIQHPALSKPRIMSKTLEKSEVSSMVSVLELFIKGQIEIKCYTSKIRKTNKC